MSSLAGPALASAALLVLAGAQKVLDPEMTVGALRSLGVPVGRSLVRFGAAVELTLGVTAIVTGGPVVWLLVSTSYAVFALVVVAALRRGTMIGSCGCFGREDTPPHWTHVVANLGLATIAGLAAVRVGGSPLAGSGDDPGGSALVIGLATVAVYLLHAVFTQLPRTLEAARTP